MTKYNVYIEVGTVEAKTEAEAKSQAEGMLENYAGSNDGSEVLANATPIVKPVGEKI